MSQDTDSNDDNPSVWDEITRTSGAETDTYTPLQSRSQAAKQTLQEREFNQRYVLRYTIAVTVVFTLWLELAALVVIILGQGAGYLPIPYLSFDPFLPGVSVSIKFEAWKFMLQEWVFGVITTGVLIQTFLGFRTIIAHLFPVENGKLPSDQ